MVKFLPTLLLPVLPNCSSSFCFRLFPGEDVRKSLRKFGTFFFLFYLLFYNPVEPAGHFFYVSSMSISVLLLLVAAHSSCTGRIWIKATVQECFGCRWLFHAPVSKPGINIFVIKAAGDDLRAAAARSKRARSGSRSCLNSQVLKVSSYFS